MLHISTILPLDSSKRVIDEVSLWEYLALPYLKGLGYHEKNFQILKRILENETSYCPSSIFTVLLSNKEEFNIKDIDVLIILSHTYIPLGELLEYSSVFIEQLPMLPPILLVVHPQRHRFVVSAFHSDTKLPLRIPFPSSETLNDFSDGLKRDLNIKNQNIEDNGINILEEQLKHSDLLDSSQSLELLWNLVHEYQIEARYSDAINTLKTLLKFYKEKNDTLGIGRIYKDIGQLFFLLEQWGESENYLQDALEIFRKENEKTLIAPTLADLAGIYLIRQSFDEAELYLKEGLKLARESSDKMNESAILNNLAQVYMHTNNITLAAQHLESSLEIIRLSGDVKEEMMTLYNLSVVYDMMGRKGLALQLVQDVRKLYEGIYSQ